MIVPARNPVWLNLSFNGDDFYGGSVDDEEFFSDFGFILNGSDFVDPSYPSSQINFIWDSWMYTDYNYGSSQTGGHSVEPVTCSSLKGGVEPYDCSETNLCSDASLDLRAFCGSDVFANVLCQTGDDAQRKRFVKRNQAYSRNLAVSFVVNKPCRTSLNLRKSILTLLNLPPNRKIFVVNSKPQGGFFF